MTFTLSHSIDRPLAQAENHSKGPIIAFPQPQLSRFKRHENLQYRSDGGLWRIHSGYVRSLTWNPEGDPVPLGFWTGGDIVGNAILQGSSSAITPTHPYEMQCLTAVTAEYLGHNYSYSKAVWLTHTRQFNDLLRIAYCRHSELRLLQFICWLANAFGEAIPGGRRILLKLTHQEIAESIGSTRVTVTRLLKILERSEKINWTTREKIVHSKTFEQSYDFLYRADPMNADRMSANQMNANCQY